MIAVRVVKKNPAEAGFPIAQLLFAAWRSALSALTRVLLTTLSRLLPPGILSIALSRFAARLSGNSRLLPSGILAIVLPRFAAGLRRILPARTRSGLALLPTALSRLLVLLLVTLVHHVLR